MTETQKAIADEAEKLYPFVQGETGLANLHNIKMRASISAYIAGRSAAEKEIAELKDKLDAAKVALKEIYTGTVFPLSIAQNALRIISK